MKTLDIPACGNKPSDAAQLSGENRPGREREVNDSPSSVPLQVAPAESSGASSGVVNPRMSLIKLREYIAKDKPKKFTKDLTLSEPLQHGWLLNYLLPLEMITWGRWEYWSACMTAGALVGPIPQIDFDGTYRNSPGRKAMEAALNVTTDWGDWRGWGSFSTFDYFLDWLLFGFGDKSQPELPKRHGNVGEHASERLYQVFNLEPLIAYPYDYLGDILAENSFGKSAGFFPTPMDVCTMMVKMTMEHETDITKSVCDPALGTGRMILVASNYSVNLWGQDILGTMCKAAKVNGYLYAPWLVKAFPFLQPRAEIVTAINHAAEQLELV